jgi:hypothetical protein
MLSAAETENRVVELMQEAGTKRWGWVFLEGMPAEGYCRECPPMLRRDLNGTIIFVMTILATLRYERGHYRCAQCECGGIR